jgi:hypothetical protein
MIDVTGSVGDCAGQDRDGGEEDEEGENKEGENMPVPVAEGC